MKPKPYSRMGRNALLMVFLVVLASGCGVPVTPVPTSQRVQLATPQLGPVPTTTSVPTAIPATEYMLMNPPPDSDKSLPVPKRRQLLLVAQRSQYVGWSRLRQWNYGASPSR